MDTQLRLCVGRDLGPRRVEASDPQGKRWGLPRGLCSVTRLRVDHVGTEQAAPAGAPGELAAIPALLFVSLAL